VDGGERRRHGALLVCNTALVFVDQYAIVTNGADEEGATRGGVSGSSAYRWIWNDVRGRLHREPFDSALSKRDRV
jgi:hypothetical protein